MDPASEGQAEHELHRRPRIAPSAKPQHPRRSRSTLSEAAAPSAKPQHPPRSRSTLSEAAAPSAKPQHPHRSRLQFPLMPNQPRASFKSPRFAQPATFMRLPHVEEPRGLDVAIVGVPFDGGTSYRPGSRLAPREIRAQSSLIRPYNYFQKVAPFDRLNVADIGDIDAPPISIDKCFDVDESRVGAIADAGARPIVVGGDHSITLPV